MTTTTTSTTTSSTARLYRTLHDQLEGGFYSSALKTCNRLMRQNPSDELASHTKIQIMLAMDRYPEALGLVQHGDTSSQAKMNKNHPHDHDLHEVKSSPSPVLTQLETAYTLYKLGREREAHETLKHLEEEGEGSGVEERAARLLEAQILYRLEDYAASRDLIDDLIHTSVSMDSPEVADLETNRAACEAALEWLSSVPDQVASSNNQHGGLESLETRPIAPLLQSFHQPRSKQQQGGGGGGGLSNLSKHKLTDPKKSEQSSKANTTRKPPRRLPKKPFDPATLPDPDRWLPKRERPGFAEEIVRKREQARGKQKTREREKLLTQGGGVESNSAQSRSGKLGGSGAGGISASTGGASGGTGAGGAAKKKKKGKK